MRPVAVGGTDTHKEGATPRRAGASPTAAARSPYTVGEARGESA